MNESSITSGALRVVFRKQHDRYAHTIECLVAGEWRVVASSIEGTPDEDWPPSPALQSLHIEQRPSGPVALLVGMAGTSHWSASIEANSSDTEKASESIVFDIACRVRGAPVRLGSMYEGREDAGQNGKVQINAIEDSTNIQRERSGPIFFLSPNSSEQNPSRTVRWRYCVTRDCS